MAWWVSFEDRESLCIDIGSYAETLATAQVLGEVNTIATLPYPAEPRLKPHRDATPSLCHSPNICKGRGACPHSYACSE